MRHYNVAFSRRGVPVRIAPVSPLALALPAMTALQATVALGVFSLAVLAPQLGLSLTRLAVLSTLMFGVGTVTALLAGRLLQRLGPWRLAALCAGAIAAGMGCLWVGGPAAPWLAVVLFGMAFGPETPASAAALAGVTPPRRRPWVFSIRQTGNQIGAMAGSMLLPWLLVVQPEAPFALVLLLALAMTAWCLVLSRHPACAPSAALPAAPVAAAPGNLERQALRRVLRSRTLSVLAIAVLCYTTLQVCLNTFLMSLAVREWHLEAVNAARWVALLQGAGLLGRLFWGWWAQRVANATGLLGAIGLLMALSGVAALAVPAGAVPALRCALVALLGFSASGWNGVLVAEVARIAGPREAGALTGTVLMFGYAGLTLAPLLFVGIGQLTSMTMAFTLILGAAGVAGLALLVTPGISTAEP